MTTKKRKVWRVAGTHPDRWSVMDTESRATALVATAKRLRVPMVPA
jgi:hypothetical protein